MALKNVFDTMKRGGYVIRCWEEYLLKKQDKKSDRALNVNAPSLIGSCVRARYYSRLGYPTARISAKAERIFNNGSYVHERIQKDLANCNVLIMDEVPVFNDKYRIQGHTDGIIRLFDSNNMDTHEIGVLEIKSINSRNFSELKGAKPEHIAQGLTYLYCIESHRQLLQKSYKTSSEFAFSWESERKEIYSAMYSHLQSGSSYSKEEKLNFQLQLHRDLDCILFHLEKPVTKAIFLYECKDNQELKEFVVDSTDDKSQGIMNNILAECVLINECVKKEEAPPRYEGAKKNTGACRWCSYQDACFVV